MPEEKQISGGGFSRDILEFLRLLEKHEVRYVIVGGEAVIFYGYPRFTGDIDFFFARDTENIERLYRCLLDFWNGSIPALQEAGELAQEGLVLQFGRPPHRLDLLNKIDVSILRRLGADAKRYPSMQALEAFGHFTWARPNCSKTKPPAPGRRISTTSSI